MGFHPDRRVVGLRTYIGMALVLGVFLLGMGYYALFRADLTDLSVRLPRAGADARGRPNLVLFLLTEAGMQEAVAAMPRLAALRPRAIWAQEAYVSSWDAGVALNPLAIDAFLGGKLTNAGYFARQVPAPPAPSGELFPLRSGSGAELEMAVAWLAEEAPRVQPFYLVLVLEAPQDNLEEADRWLGDVVQVLDRTNLMPETALVVTALAGKQELDRPARWRVPLLLHYPRRLAQEIELGAAVSQRNLLYTLLDIAGLDGPYAIGDSPQTASLFTIHAQRMERRNVVVEGHMTESIGAAFGSGDQWVVWDGQDIANLNGGPADPTLAAALSAWIVDHTSMAAASPLQGP